MRIKIRLDTVKDINEFVGVASSIEDKISVTDGDGLTVNAKSMLGVMYSWSEWDRIYLISEKDYYNEFKKFIIE